ncbi:MAG: SxtJ family membrane protein [Acidobacteriota bacterium]
MSEGDGMETEGLSINTEKCKDSGLALVLILLICFQVWKLPFLIPAAIILLFAAMIYPPVFKPFTWLWFGLSMMLSLVISRILLILIYFLVVVPVAILRRLIGKDSMQLKRWKKTKDSVFRQRNHQFEVKDFENPY